MAKTLFKKLLTKSRVMWLLEEFTDWTSFKFDNELVDVGEALYDGDHQRVITELQQLMDAVQQDWNNKIKD